MDNNWYRKYDAPIGKVWECQACGKISLNQVRGPRGWDESCFLNAILKEENDDDTSVSTRKD